MWVADRPRAVCPGMKIRGFKQRMRSKAKKVPLTLESRSALPSLKTLPYVALPPPGVFFPKNYCGPGANGGWPTNNVDAACMQHDEAYADAGINWRTKLNLMVNPWASRGKKQAAAADQELCSSVGSVVPASSQEFYDQWGVSLFFGCSD